MKYNYGAKWRTEVVIKSNYWAISSKKNAIKKERKKEQKEKKNARRRLLPMLSPAPVAQPRPPSRSQEPQRGIIYVQPSYHYTNTRQLSFAAFERDLVSIAALPKKVVNLGLRVSWGDLMTHWNATTQTASYNESYCTKLGAMARALEARGMKLVFNTHLKEHVPTGLPGILWRPPTPDIYNVSGGAGDDVWRSSYGDLMVRDEYAQPILAFHEKFAACLAPGTGVRWWKHAFESCYLFPSPAANKNADAARTKFALWAEAQNASIAHWAERWDESNLRSFSSVTLPNQTNGKLDAAARAKNGDFFRFWLLGVLRDGTYGLSIPAIAAALQRGAAASGWRSGVSLGFKHWQVMNFQRLTDLTQAELQRAFDLPGVNLTALGYYVNTEAELAQEPALFDTYINATRAVAPVNLPMVVWETGASTLALSPAQQASWLDMVEAAVVRHKLLGFNWWQIVDWAPRPGEKDGIGLHFGLTFLNGTRKDAWGGM